MRKKDRRRRVEPTGTEPAQPQSTWAHSPGSKCSVRKAGRGLGRNLAHEGLENRVAALVALFFEPLENLLGRIGVLCQQADNLALILVRVQAETNNPGPCTDAPHPVLVRSQPWQARFQGSHHPAMSENTRFGNSFSRSSSHRCSCGLSSGESPGRRCRRRVSGTTSALATCQLAPSN